MALTKTPRSDHTHAVVYVGAPYGDKEGGHVVSLHRSADAAWQALPTTGQHIVVALDEVSLRYPRTARVHFAPVTYSDLIVSDLHVLYEAAGDALLEAVYNLLPAESPDYPGLEPAADAAVYARNAALNGRLPLEMRVEAVYGGNHAWRERVEAARRETRGGGNAYWDAWCATLSPDEELHALLRAAAAAAERAAREAWEQYHAED